MQISAFFLAAAAMITIGCRTRGEAPTDAGPALSRDDRVREAVFKQLLRSHKNYELYFLATGKPEQNVSEPLLSKVWLSEKRIRNFSDCQVGEVVHEKVTGKPGAVLVATIVKWTGPNTAQVKGDCIPSALQGGGFQGFAERNDDGEWTLKNISKWKY
jgi:hypothetical protein